MRRAVIAPRWRKVVRDIFERPGRSILAVIAMTAGVFALGTIVFEQAFLRPVLTTMYGNTHPASATVFTDSVDDALIDSVRSVPGVADAEARPVLLARARAGQDEWVPAILYVIRDFEHQRLDFFKRDDGAWPPGIGDVLLERSAVAVAKALRGANLTVRTAGGDEQVLNFAGTVHAAGLAPAWMEHVVYGFVPWNSKARGDGSAESAQIRFIVAQHPMDEGHIREVADRVKAMLEREHHEVSRVDVPIPGRHPHADQMDTFLYLLGSFGILSFLLSAVLVASMIHALLIEQLRQVGMMKAIGATTRQIAGIYLAQVAVLATMALAIGVPLAFFAGRAYARFSAGILNADVTRSPFPVGALVAIAVVGIVVPLAVALGPVLRASRITVHQALNDDLGPRPFGSRRLEQWLAAIAWIPRPLMLSLRTTFLRRGRLALTVIMLALGGAVFMSALNVSGAWNRAVVKDFRMRRYDLSVRFAEAQPIDVIDAALKRMSSVVNAEYWPGAAPYLIGPTGAAGSTVAMAGPTPGSTLLTLPLEAGRWLRPDDSTGVVINNAVLIRNPTLRVGGKVEVRQEGRTHAFPIVGIVKELSPMAVIYAPASAVLGVTGQSGDHTRLVRVVTREHTAQSQLATTRELERTFEAMGVEVAGLQSMLDVRKGILDHLVIIMAVLTMAATIVVLVGSLGLTSTLSINVIQRTREIGILGAIGATPRAISSHVWIESVVIGLLSWGVANLLAAPISWVLESVTGRMFFKAPLEFHMSASAALIWLGLTLVLASFSSLYPAWRAARLTVREALSTT
jgi:putative ABC transport system permease protein